MLRKGSLFNKILVVVCILTLPYSIISMSSRIAFSEWFIDWQYSLESFPEDPYGMSKEERKRLAKLGLKAVTSDEGMEEFKKAKLPDGRPAFRDKEIKHMEDVKNLLSVLFPLGYILMTMDLIILLYLSFINKKLLGTALIGGGSLCLILLVSAGAFSLIDYDLAFEKFHDLFFDPYSWRFRHSDTLLRIYPKVFWFNGTIFVISLSVILSLLSIIIGFLIRRRYALPPFLPTQ